MTIFNWNQLMWNFQNSYGVKLLKEDAPVGYLMINGTEEGWNYKILGTDYLVINEDIYKDKDHKLAINEVIDTIMSDLKKSEPNRYEFIDYDELFYQNDMAEIYEQEANKQNITDFFDKEESEL